MSDETGSTAASPPTGSEPLRRRNDLPAQVEEAARRRFASLQLSERAKGIGAGGKALLGALGHRVTHPPVWAVGLVLAGAAAMGFGGAIFAAATSSVPVTAAVAIAGVSLLTGKNPLNVAKAAYQRGRSMFKGLGTWAREHLTNEAHYERTAPAPEAGDVSTTETPSKGVETPDAGGQENSGVQGQGPDAGMDGAEVKDAEGRNVKVTSKMTPDQLSQFRKDLWMKRTQHEFVTYNETIDQILRSIDDAKTPAARSAATRQARRLANETVLSIHQVQPDPKRDHFFRHQYNTVLRDALKRVAGRQVAGGEAIQDALLAARGRIEWMGERQAAAEQQRQQKREMKFISDLRARAPELVQPYIQSMVARQQQMQQGAYGNAATQPQAQGHEVG